MVIPTYNEAENLSTLVHRLFDLRIDGLGLIIVDDSSPDGTGELAESLSLKYGNAISVISRPKKDGLGTAYKEGFELALSLGCEAVIQMDADLSHRPEYIPKMLSMLGKYDVVVGSRYIDGGGTDDKWGLGRKILSSVGNFGIKLVSGIKVKDATSGFKAFRISALRIIPWENIQCKGFGFQSEVAFHSQRLKYSVYEMPIVFDERLVGKSKMSIRIAVEAMFRMLFLRIFGYSGFQK